MTGQHTRRPSTLRRTIPAVAACAVLGLGLWAGTFLGPPGDQVAGAPPAPTTLSTASPTSPPASNEAPASTLPTTTIPTTAAVPSQPAPAAPDNGSVAFEEQVVALVNTERAAAGCPAMTVDSRLTAAARAHSADMAQRGYFDHTTPEGVTFAQRIERAGYSWSAAAENIARGQADPAAVMSSWMNSDGHRRNILNCGLRQIGVGLAYDTGNRPHWTQDFATPR